MKMFISIFLSSLSGCLCLLCIVMFFALLLVVVIYSQVTENVGAWFLNVMNTLLND